MSGDPRQLSPKGGGTPATQKQQQRDSSTRRWAEWVSLTISGLLLMSLAGYMLLQALRRDEPFVVAETRPLMDQVRRKGETFMLPLEITNPGRRTLRDLKVEVRFRTGPEEWETQDLQIDYLGKGSRQRVYLYFDRHPRDLKVEANPVQYRLD